MRTCQPPCGIGLDEQRGRRPLGRPRVAGVVERVVDPRERARARDGVDGAELPVAGGRAAGLHVTVEAEIGQRPGQAVVVREVLVGALLPSSAPDKLEALSQPKQVHARLGRKEVWRAIDRLEAALWTRVRGETPEGEDAVDVHQQERFPLLYGIFVEELHG